MARERLRFAFTIPEGPNAGLTCNGWRLWVSGEDTYIAAVSLQGSWKVSLHADEAWQLAVTKEELAKVRPVYAGRERAPWRFRPTPFVDGRRLAFVIAVCRSALLPGRLVERERHIAVADRWDQLTMAYVWMSEPEVEVHGARPVGGPLPLASGRRVWVTAHTQRLESGEAEPPAVASMVEPMWPPEHDVAAPGIMLRGVRFSDEAA